MSIEGVTCPVCGKELYDKHNLEDHFRYDHKELKAEDYGAISIKDNSNSELANRIP